MTTSLQDGQSAAGRAAARDSPLAAQVCSAAQGRGDARDLAPAPWLHARALLPPPDGTRGCAADRRKKKDLNVLEMPSIPNPFPELCCSPFTSVLSAGLFPKATSRKKQVIKVHSEDETSRALEVPSDITARDVCQLLILKNHYIDDHSWTLFEHLLLTGLERIIEDHELVVEVLSNWGVEEENKLYFRKNYAKYEFFKNPMYFFPEHMVSFATETNGEISPTQILQMFLSSSTYPEIHGFLHAKEQGKKSWKKIYFFLRRSGLYFSTKGTSKEPRHLQFFSEFGNSDIYVSLAGKKKHGAPSNYGFCFKPNKARGPRDLRMLCAEEEQSRMCWVTAIRLLKYGMQLYQNYMHPYQGRGGCSSQSISPMRSISENSLVAMDFSGQTSRVIENPTEALSVAVEEGLAWRKKGCLRLGTHGSPTASSHGSATNMAIHRSQPWFHHRISRDEAQRLIMQQGLVDGVFLVRDSQSNPKTFVLSMSHAQKIKHFQIIPVEDDGEMFHTLDDGHTRFTDLIQLVEFYQLNKGVLPCKLKHYCARITL
ncbi:growth factor receptor-bound protein 14 isoform X1 [Molossus molossus]|uniref:Growth factor receptor-bound protein 14 n=2 Tax=Molossus molossus TaxID=27622 RepID=A0A7J8FRG9_MOLMO|nr:growth factor receptor-bound protein 14 isoform X1 [Molossus molossus]KAF6450246.1 growth factor receptor bound protein 14 [Molossus molossus]